MAAITTRLAATLTFILAGGCASTSNSANDSGANNAALADVDVAAHNRQAAARLYVFPQFKYVAEPRFCFSSDDRQRALDASRDLGADTLYELIVESDGTVKRCDLIKTDIRPDYHEDVEARGLHFKFNEDRKTKLYRAFYYPVKFDYKVEFEWLDAG